MSLVVALQIVCHFVISQKSRKARTEFGVIGLRGNDWGAALPPGLVEEDLGDHVAPRDAAPLDLRGRTDR